MFELADALGQALGQLRKGKARETKRLVILAKPMEFFYELADARNFPGLMVHEGGLQATGILS